MARPHLGLPARARLVAPAAVVLLGLAACSGGGDASTAGEAGASSVGQPGTVEAGADCLAPQVLADLGFDPAAYTGSRHPDVPDAAGLPEGFTAASAVRCSTGETLTDAAGTWAAVTASRLEGDVRPLVEAVSGRATLPAAGGATPTCAPDGDRSELWLVDALGVAVRVVLPGGGCEPLPTAVADGLAALDAVDVEHYPVALVAPTPGASTGPTTD